MTDSLSAKVVRLNIGGCEYLTSTSTLIDGPHSPPKDANFFHALVNGKTTALRIGEAFFIDRDGKYFEPILEFLRTGDVVLPPGMSASSVIREAEFYGVKFPLSEDSPDLLYVNDEWLQMKKAEQEYKCVCQGGDDLLSDVLADFRECAVEGRRIQSRPFVRETRDNGLTATAIKIAKLAQRQHETQDIRHALEQQALKYSADKQDRVNGNFFRLLDDRQSRSILMERCRRNGLSVEVHPTTIKVNWKGTESFWTIGYYFLHRPEKQ